MIIRHFKHIRSSAIIAFSTVLLAGCVMNTEEGPKKKTKVVDNELRKDLGDIIKEGELRVLFENSSTSYFNYRGKKMGFEYELLRLFAKDLGVDLNIVVINNLDSITEYLKEGKGDLVACNYTVTKERSKLIDFSEPILQTKQVLVQRKPEGYDKLKAKEKEGILIDDPSELSQKSVHVWKNSSYYQRLLHLQEEIGDSIHIEEVDGTVGGEELIEMVSSGIIDYTITEENVALVNNKFYDNLDTQVGVSVKQKIAFGLRKSSNLLKAKLDQWLVDIKKKTIYKYLYKKYFVMGNVAQNHLKDNSSLDGRNISPYDDIFRKAGEKINWDWRLIASVAYQESKFNPNALSFGGAYGMMQFMPNTGPTYGVYPDSPPEQQIMGGAKKLAADEKFWDEVPDPIQRKKFCMASYNAGRGHILDAQRLAKKHGLNPLVWDNNVEAMLLNLSKKEYYQDPVVKCGVVRSTTTYKYVNHVFQRFNEWKSIYN